MFYIHLYFMIKMVQVKLKIIRNTLLSIYSEYQFWTFLNFNAVIEISIMKYFLTYIVYIHRQNRRVWISRETSFTGISHEFHVKFVSSEFHVKLSREFHVKLVSREIHVKYFTWIAGESSFTWNSREIYTYISREFCE